VKIMGDEPSNADPSMWGMNRPFGGLQFTIIPTWEQGFAWRFLSAGKRVPTKAAGRKGTRRAWKRKHPVGLRWRYGPVEPANMLRMGDRVIMTHRQHAAVMAAISTGNARDGASPKIPQPQDHERGDG
jgi:hypothetical protein